MFQVGALCQPAFRGGAGIAEWGLGSAGEIGLWSSRGMLVFELISEAGDR